MGKYRGPVCVKCGAWAQAVVVAPDGRRVHACKDHLSQVAVPGNTVTYHGPPLPPDVFRVAERTVG